jgi:hypothetical protein
MQELGNFLGIKINNKPAPKARWIYYLNQGACVYILITIDQG